MTQSRQLSAIMFTDIVGYTSLMGKDEQRAFEILNKNREIQKPIIEQYNGRWIKELGDGVMASFNTVSDAVNAAIKIQQICNSSKEFQLRIGIHLGEVVFENDDVFGDGVNITSRIQAIANPGSISISEAVNNNIANKKEFQTKFIKKEKLKNVKEPVKIYQVIAEGVTVVQHHLGQKIKPKPRGLLIFITLIALCLAGYLIKGYFTTQKNTHTTNPDTANEKSIAVLPFINLGADSTQEYFSDGMTESIMTDLAQVPGLLVIGRNSVFQFKGNDANPIEIGNQLHVRYILQGRVQHSGDDLRITAQLIETQKGSQVWGNKFDRKMKDIFLVQDDISHNIIDSLKIIIAKGKGSTTKQPTQNLEAYDSYLRGYYLLRKAAATDRNLIDSAIIMFEKAISLDSKFALAYAALGKACNSLFFIYDSDPKWENKAYVAIEKALSIDPKLADAYVAKGNLLWTLANGFPVEKAIREYKHAIELNPNLVEAHESLGSIYFHIGMFDAALKEFRIALTLDPSGRFSRPRIARIHWYQQKYDSALTEFSYDQLPTIWLREKALVLWYLDRKDEAFNTLTLLETLNKTKNDESDIAAVYSVFLAGVGKKHEAEEKIKFAIEYGKGVSHFHHAEHLIASAYALMGNTSSAVAWLQKASDHGFPCYPLFKTDPNLRNIRKDSAYISLMEKLKKQWEDYNSKL